MTDEIKRVSYNIDANVLTVLAKHGRTLKFNVLDQDGAFRGPPLQPLKEHNQTHGCYTGVPIVKPQPGDRIVIVPADELVMYGDEQVFWQGEPVVTDGDAIDFVECQKQPDAGEVVKQSLVDTDKGVESTDWGRQEDKTKVCKWIHQVWIKKGKPVKAIIIRDALNHFGLPKDYYDRVRKEFNKRHKNNKK